MAHRRRLPRVIAAERLSKGSRSFIFRAVRTKGVTQMLMIGIAIASANLTKAVDTYYSLERQLNNWSDLWFHDEIETQEKRIGLANDEIYRWQDILGAYDPPLTG